MPLADVAHGETSRLQLPLEAGEGSEAAPSRGGRWHVPAPLKAFVVAVRAAQRAIEETEL